MDDINSDSHTEQLHFQRLQQLCRICGERSLKQKERKQSRKPHKCVDLKDDINSFFVIDVKDDIPSKHSSTICHSCVTKMCHYKIGRIKKAALQKARGIAKSTQSLWTSFLDGTDCSVCAHYAWTAKGRGRKKKTNVREFDKSEGKIKYFCLK